MNPTIKPNYKSTFHRDSTVSFWSVYSQQWERLSKSSIPDRVLASLSREERAKIIN